MKINSLPKYSNLQASRSFISKTFLGTKLLTSGHSIQLLFTNIEKWALIKSQGAHPSREAGQRPLEGRGRERRPGRQPPSGHFFWRPGLPLLPSPAVSFAVFQRVTPARSRPRPLTGAGCAKQSHVPPFSRGRCSRRARNPAPAPPQRTRRRHV